MKILPLIVITTLAGICLSGCETIVAGEMNRLNEKDLQQGRQTPSEYRARRDEIERNLNK